MNQRLIPNPKRPLSATLPDTGTRLQVQVEARAERFCLIALATRTAGDGLRVPTGRPLPLGTRVDVLLRCHPGDQGIWLRAMVTGSQQRRGCQGMELVLLPPPRPANA